MWDDTCIPVGRQGGEASVDASCHIDNKVQHKLLTTDIHTLREQKLPPGK